MADAGSQQEKPSEPESPSGQAGPEDEARRKFREALERKRAQHGDASAARGGKGAGKVHGAHGPAGGKRTFRRRSGG